MDRNTFLKQLNNGSLQGIYIFEGKEEYLKQRTLAELEASLLPEGLEALNEATLDMPDIDSVFESALVLPFMCDKRLVVAKDPPFLRKKSRAAKKDKDEEGSDSTDTDSIAAKDTDGASDADSANMAELVSKLDFLNQNNPTCITVLYLRSNFERAKLKKISWEDKVVSFDQLKDYELVQWIKNRFKEQNKSVSNDAAYELARCCGADMNRLELEIHKLSSYKAESSKVGADDIHELILPDLESSIFKMTDALLAGRSSLAYGILNSMLEHGESRIMILYMITRQIRNMCYIKTMHEQGFSNIEIIRSLDLNERYPLGNTLEQSKAFSIDRLNELYRRAVEYETMIKTGKIGESQGLDEMLTVLCSHAQNKAGTMPMSHASK